MSGQVKEKKETFLSDEINNRTISEPPIFGFKSIKNLRSCGYKTGVVRTCIMFWALIPLLGEVIP